MALRITLWMKFTKGKMKLCKLTYFCKLMTPPTQKSYHSSTRNQLLGFYILILFSTLRPEGCYQFRQIKKQ